MQPYALNAATLATRGVDTLGDVLQRGLPFDAGSPLANRLLGAPSAVPPGFRLVMCGCVSHHTHGRPCHTCSH